MGAHISLIPGTSYTFTVDAHDHGVRLDTFVTQQFPSYSRSLFKKLIEDSCVTINNKPSTKAGTTLKVNDVIHITVPFAQEREPLNQEAAKKLGVHIVHQEKDFAIVNKPAGLMTHAPHAESMELSLVDWLLTQFKDIKSVGYQDRPGIVHRLDKDTSGLLIIPLVKQAHTLFSDMFKDKTIRKVYYAIVTGHPDKEGVINFPIGRHTTQRNKMTHRTDGRQSVTRFKVKEYFDKHTLVEVFPETGRTHQIRVHFATIGHPLLGDAMYGKPSHLIDRHALHAAEIGFTYNEQERHFTLPLPFDFDQVLSTLRKQANKN